nr:ash family protein [Providencia rettgeri]
MRHSEYTPAKSGVGIGVLNLLIGAYTALAVFLYAEYGYIFSMVSCAGASKDAPVSY